MPVSGMAKVVRSVTTRTFAGREMPTPPPMTTPSIRAMTGFSKAIKRAFS